MAKKRSFPGTGIPTAMLSLVGNQPAAIAIPVMTWARWVEAPAKVALFCPTTATLEVARRTKAFLDSSLPHTKCTVEEPKVGQTDGRADISLQILRWVEDHAKDHRLCLLVEPGPKPAAVALSRQLRDALALATDGSHLLVTQPAASVAEKFKLEGLGVQKLLELHGLQPSAVTFSSHASLTFQLGTQALTLHQPSEIAGYLHGLYYVSAERGKEDLRFLESLSANPHLLGHLRPRIAVVLPEPEVVRRRPQRPTARAVRKDGDYEQLVAARRREAGEHEHLRLRAETAGFETLTWAAAQQWKPSRATGRAHGKSLRLLPGPAAGRGGVGNRTLMLWLGTDVTTTLLAIYSHRPAIAIVLVDLTTDRVRELATRLAAEAPELPVGTLQFAGADLFGALQIGAARDLQRHDRLDFNFTPGTAMQAFAVASAFGAALWSIRLGSKPVVAPTGDTGMAPLPLVSPPIDVLARVNGGSLSRRIRRPAWTVGERTTLVAAGRILANWLNQHLARTLPLRQSIVQNYGEEANTLTCEPVAGSASEMLLSVPGSEPVRTGVGGSGAWLEDIVAACLLEAGADDVVCGLGWKMPRPGITNSARERDELDVIARFGHQYFLFDCKAGDLGLLVPKGTPPELTEETGDEWHRTLAQALAKRLQRFAIPVAVRPRVPEVQLRREGAALLDLSIITDTSRLPEALKAIGQRSTVA